MNCQQLARLLKALAEPTRLRLFCLLSRHEVICVCNLTEILQLPQYHVSRHLAILRHAGIVVDERDGGRMNYRLSGDSEIIRQLAGVLQSSVASCPGAKEDVKRANKVLNQNR